MARRTFEFTSPHFGPASEDEQLVNAETMHGHALASFLCEQLRPRGIAAKVTVAEDWGWLCELEGDFPVPVSFGCTGEDDRYVVQVHPEGDYVRRLFRKTPVGEAPGQVAEALFDIVATSDLASTGPEWH